MAAAVVTGHGGLEKLEIRRVQVPAAGPGDVLVRVKACALNNTDIWFREGAYGTIEDPGAVTGPQRRPGEFPRVPGADVAGEIVAVGEGVSPRQLGKAVVLFFFQSPGPLREEHMAESMTILGSDHDGGYAEYVCWPSDLCFPLPFDDFERSAALTLAGLTAWNMIERARIAQGEKVLVTGATGGVGSLAVQIAARVFGAAVIAVAR
ncbi:MAG: alcohol dehydrogenase catalytic domain-containing protein, partial [Dehalococcoidia bacterium]